MKYLLLLLFCSCAVNIEQDTKIKHYYECEETVSHNFYSCVAECNDAYNKPCIEQCSIVLVVEDLTCGVILK